MMLGEKVRIIRKQANISQTRLSQKAGIACSTLCDIEKNRMNPSLKTLEKIATALNVPLAGFFMPSNSVENVNTRTFKEA